MEPIFFYSIALIMITLSIAVVRSKDVLYSALYLVLAMFHMALLYALFSALFVAAIQIIVYAGAVMVLMLFIIMLLPRQADYPRSHTKISILLAIIFVLEIAGGLYTLTHEELEITLQDTSIERVARELFGKFLLPFESVSLVLLIAVVGVVLLAKQKDPEVRE
jgi:NADH-quinone oxidoreductase subunit J